MVFSSSILLLFLLVITINPSTAVKKVHRLDDLDDEEDNHPLMLAKHIIHEGHSSAPVIEMASMKGKSRAFGIFLNGTESIGMDTGIVLSTGKASNARGKNEWVEREQKGEFWYTAGVNSLDDIVSPENTVDGAVLSIKFKCPNESRRVAIEFVFGTDEITSCAPNCAWNDVMGIWLNRNNIALLPNGQPLTVNNVQSAGAFKDNLNEEYYVEADHFTHVLKAQGNIGAASNNLHIMIADTFAYQVDSWAFIKAASFKCI